MIEEYIFITCKHIPNQTEQQSFNIKLNFIEIHMNVMLNIVKVKYYFAIIIFNNRYLGIYYYKIMKK